MLEPTHSLVTNCSVVEACVQVRAEGPMEHIAPGKRSDTLGFPHSRVSTPCKVGCSKSIFFCMVLPPLMHGLKAQKRLAQGKRSDTLGQSMLVSDAL